MKCECCSAETVGYALYDYCAACSKNLCAKCMTESRCRDSKDGRHDPSAAAHEPQAPDKPAH